MYEKNDFKGFKNETCTNPSKIAPPTIILRCSSHHLFFHWKDVLKKRLP